MGKFRVLVECSNEGGTDLNCLDGIQAKDKNEAEHKAVEMARRYYTEFDEFEPVRVEEAKRR